MKIKFDFWVTPDGYTGDGHPSIGRAYRVKGGVEIPKPSLRALLTALVCTRVALPQALSRSDEILRDAESEELSDG